MWQYIVRLFRRADPLTAAGERALAEAERMWRLDVFDPQRSDRSPRADRCRTIIDDILRRAGWVWEVPYRGDGQVEWCGLFAAACWRTAGLEPKWLAPFWASTLRMDHWFRYRAWNATSAGERPDTGARMLIELTAFSRAADCVFRDGTAPRAGDIVVVGDGSPEAGDHIVVCVSYADGVFKTIGGNGGGLGPDGKRRQGIVKADFRVGGVGYCVRRVYRPGVGDLT